MAASSGDIMNNEELRIVVSGKTGTGKSATGNTILGRECFESVFSPASVTVECSKGRGTADGQRVTVIDTPGLFDTRFDEEMLEKLIKQCVTEASPGPHVFLVVIRLCRFTEEEKKTVERIQQVFGQAADRYSMVLFTGGDQLDSTIEEFLGRSRDLQDLVARCSGHYHVFNNRSRDRSQVTELLQKIRNMVQKNGGSHYTNEMFQEAERKKEEEKQRILKEEEERKRKEEEEHESKIKQEYENKMRELKEEEEEKQQILKEQEKQFNKEKAALERKLRQQQAKEKREFKKQIQAERQREKREREQERRREREEREKEREEERRRERKREEEREEDKKRRKEEKEEDRKREEEREQVRRREREEERKRMKEEREEERKREREEWEQERKRMRREMDEAIKRVREERREENMALVERSSSTAVCDEIRQLRRDFEDRMQRVDFDHKPHRFPSSTPASSFMD